MANTVLSNYIDKQTAYLIQAEAGNMPLPDMFTLQELNYRISALQTMQAFCRTAPLSTDTRALGFHFQMAKSYMQGLLVEHKLGPKADENGLKKRETAFSAMKRIFDDNCNRFASFSPSSAEHYKNCLLAMVNTVLPAWLQYRETYVAIDARKGVHA